MASNRDGRLSHRLVTGAIRGDARPLRHRPGTRAANPPILGGANVCAPCTGGVWHLLVRATMRATAMMIVAEEAMPRIFLTPTQRSAAIRMLIKPGGKMPRVPRAASPWVR